MARINKYISNLIAHILNIRSLIGVFGTAEQLMKEFAENEAKKKTLPWARPPRSGSSGLRSTNLPNHSLLLFIESAILLSTKGLMVINQLIYLTT